MKPVSINRMPLSERNIHPVRDFRLCFILVYYRVKKMNVFRRALLIIFYDRQISRKRKQADQGWLFEGIRFAMKDFSKRPFMAFIIFAREHSDV